MGKQNVAWQIQLAAEVPSAPVFMTIRDPFWLFNISGELTEGIETILMLIQLPI